MPPSVTVLYVGSEAGALDLASELSAVGVLDAAVVSTTPSALSDVVTDDRLDCLVYATENTNGTLATVREQRPDLPVVGFGSDVDDGLTVTVDDEGGVEQLATCLGEVLAGNPDGDHAERRLTEAARGTAVYFAVDEDWRVTHWDQRMEDWTETAPTDALGATLWDLLPEMGETDVAEQFRDVMTTRTATTVELPYGPTGVWLELRAAPDEDGGIEFFSRDITARKERQRELAETRRRLERTLQRIEDAFFAVDDDWQVTYFNQRAEEMLGVEEAAAIGENLWDLFPEAVESRFYEEYTAAMQTQEQTQFEAYYEPLGTWFEVRAYPSETGLSVYFQDVTERRERQQEVRRLSRAIEEAPIGISITDPSREDNPLVYVNDGFERLTGYTEAEIVGRNCRFLQGPNTNPSTVETMRDAIDAVEPVSVEILNYRNDGTQFWNQVDIAPVRDESGSLLNFVGFQRDVTADHQLEARLRALHETAQELMAAETDEEIGHLVVEAASDILDLPLTTLWHYDRTNERFVAVARTEAAADQFERSVLPVDADDGTLGATETPGWTALQSGELQVYDDLQAEVEGGHTIPVRSSIVAPLGDYGVLATAGMESYEFDDSDADLFRILATSTETALARDERERELQRQNERLDEFVSVVSHDLRNPLQVAMTRLETYRETGDESDLDIVASNHARINDLIDGLLTLARQGETVSDPQHVTLSAVANRAWTTVDTADATLEMTTAATLMADDQRLQQLFENLFRNAVEHAGEDVTISVDTLPDGSDTPGFYVADDGPGIPPADREGIFEHGFSTGDRGNGLGLSIVKRIADAHGWDISATESESGGARFEVTGITSLTSTG